MAFVFFASLIMMLDYLSTVLTFSYSFSFLLYRQNKISFLLYYQNKRKRIAIFLNLQFSQVVLN